MSAAPRPASAAPPPAAARSRAPSTEAPADARSSVQGSVTRIGPTRLSGTRDVQTVALELERRQRTFELCYEQALRRDPSIAGAVRFRFTVTPAGTVDVLLLEPGGTAEEPLIRCTIDVVRRFRLPQEDKASTYRAAIRYTAPRTRLRSGQPTIPARPSKPERELPPELSLDSALEGPLLSVLSTIQSGNVQAALVEAWRYRAQEPGSVLALIALGQALAASGDVEGAARAYGSIIDLFPSRADMRRTAGNYLEPLATPGAITLTLDTYAKAREQRPDHPHSHRLHAFALLKAGRPAEAFQVLREGHGRSYPAGRFPGIKTILAEDLSIVASAWKRADPSAKEHIDEQLRRLELSPDTTPSLRFILSWETDANDVDFHIYDGQHGHAFHASRELPSGGDLVDDVRNGYGPERFLIRTPRAFPYQLIVHYYSRGPMGVGMGKVQLAYHDGKGNVSFEERPFVIMKDSANLDLGKLERTASIFGKTRAPAVTKAAAL